MTSLSSFQVVDNVTDNRATLHNRLLGGSLSALFSNTETIAGTKILEDGDCQFQILTASGADRTVTLAPESSGNHFTVIYNAGGSNNIVVKDDSETTTFRTLAPGEWEMFYPIPNVGWKLPTFQGASETAQGIVELATSTEVNAGTDNTRAISPNSLMGSIFAMKFVCQGRLTLTSGTPITTANVTGAGTVYFTPYQGNLVALYDGSNWKLYSFAEISLALTITDATPYDVFLYDNAGTLTLELTAWTNATTRATALTLQDGVLVKTGATTRRYLGSLYASGTNTTEDSTSKRYLFNYYNRVMKKLKAVDGTNSWTHGSAAWREANAGSTLGTSRVALMIGWSEDTVYARSTVLGSASSGNPIVAAGIGIDSTSTNSAEICISTYVTAFVGLHSFAEYNDYPGVGMHIISWLENGGSNVTLYGDNGASAANITQSGLIVRAWM